MADLIDTTEMYLRTILELEEEGIVPLRARISERIGHSGPTVSQTVARMERDGLVVVTEDRRLELTAKGREKAIQVMRKHRLAERLLFDVIGLEWEYVHEEACRWEHVISERVEKRILQMLEQPTKSPYGNPIPGLEQLGVQLRGSFALPIISVFDVFLDTGVATFEAEISRFAEPAQNDAEQLKLLLDAKIVPGARVTFTKQGKRVQIETAAQEVVTVSKDLAAHIFVLKH